MMVEKADLGLSLSLGCSENLQPPPYLQLSLMASPPSPPPVIHQRPQWGNLLASLASERGSRGREGLAALDVNGSPAAEREIDGEDEEEEVAVVSSPNSALSNGSGKRDPGDCAISDEEGEGSRKKLRLSKDQAAVLEESFKEHSTLSPKQKLALAKELGLRPRQVEVWFQNRRARTKLKQTEMDCEYLKRCCENLTAENRRLTKEVAELRALKLSPHLYMQMTPPTTLTMCPSCERVSSSAASPPSETAPASDLRRRLPTPIAAAPAPWSLMPLRVSGSCAPSSTVLIRSTH